MTRQVFFSFHYALDSWRTQQVRNIGVVDGNKPVSPNHWEEVRRRGSEAIKQWIHREMRLRSCVVVLVGARTANRRWVRYEIEHAWSAGKGVVGICIHGLKDQDEQLSVPGANPFGLTVDGVRLASVVKCYNPPGRTSTDRHAWIAKHLSPAVEEAIAIRGGRQ